MLLTRLLTLRSFRLRPLRLLFSAFGIILGVAGILAIGIANQTALESVSRLFKDTSGRANLVITPAGDEAGGFSEKLLQRLAGAPGIAASVPSLHLQTALAGAAAPAEIGLSFFGSSAGGLTLYGIDPRLDPQARAYRVTAGRFLSSDLAAEELLLVDSYAAEQEIQVGDPVELLTGTGVEALRVVGLIAKEGPGQLNNGAFGVLPLQTAQQLFDRDGRLDQVDLLVAPGLDTTQGLEALRATLQERLGPAYAVTYPAAQGQRMTQMLGNYQIGLNFLSGMALFVGAFLIYNAFSMTVVERTREFGMLRTVGMTRPQVVRQVLVEAGLLGVVGSGLGLALGVLLAGGLTRVMGMLLGQDLAEIEIPPGSVIAGGAAGLVVTLFAAVIPAVQAGRISPLEALRVRAGRREGWLVRRGWLLGIALLGVSAAILVLNPFPYDVQFRLGSAVVVGLFLGGTLTIPASVRLWERLTRPLVRLLYGPAGQLGSRNLERSRQRTTLTVAALMIGVAMIVIVWAMTGSFKQDLDAWLQGYIGGDLYIGSTLPLRKDLWQRLEGTPGVAAVAPVSYFEVRWLPPGADEQKLMFMAFDPASYTRVTRFIFSKTAGGPGQALNQVAGGGAVLISSVLSEKYGLGPGSAIRLVTRHGARDFQVAGVVVDYFNQGLVVQGSWADMSREFKQRDANALYLKLEPGYAAAAVQAQIDRLYGERYHLTIETNQALLARVSVLIRQAFAMFDVLALIAILVASLGISNTMTMNVLERTREIGMLRSVGLTRGQLVRMILAEAGVMGLIGGLLGLAFGWILARIFLLAMTAMSGYSLPFLLPAGRLGAALLAAVTIANLAALLPAGRAARTRILDAIQYE